MLLGLAYTIRVVSVFCESILSVIFLFKKSTILVRPYILFKINGGLFDTNIVKVTVMICESTDYSKLTHGLKENDRVNVKGVER